jgi:hypothetical protein
MDQSTQESSHQTSSGSRSYVPAHGQAPNTQPAYGQAPNTLLAYGQAPNTYDTRPAYGQAPNTLPAYGQAPNTYGTLPAYGQAPNTYGTLPAYGQAPNTYGTLPAYGQAPNTLPVYGQAPNPPQAYGQGGHPQPIPPVLQLRNGSLVKQHPTGPDLRDPRVVKLYELGLLVPKIPPPPPRTPEDLCQVLLMNIPRRLTTQAGDDGSNKEHQIQYVNRVTRELEKMNIKPSLVLNTSSWESAAWGSAALLHFSSTQEALKQGVDGKDAVLALAGLRFLGAPYNEPALDALWLAPPVSERGNLGYVSIYLWFLSAVNTTSSVFEGEVICTVWISFVPFFFLFFGPLLFFFVSEFNASFFSLVSEIVVHFGSPIFSIFLLLAILRRRWLLVASLFPHLFLFAIVYGRSSVITDLFLYLVNLIYNGIFMPSCEKYYR